MRLPVLPTLVFFVIALAIDLYLWRRLKKSPAKPVYARIQMATAIVLNLGLLLIICLPKRSGDNSELELLMWGLYAYFSIYIPKILFLIFDLLSSIPRLWHHRRSKILSGMAWVVSVAVFLLMWWGALVNRYCIDVNEIEVEIPGLPQSFDGYTIAQISDLHVGSFGSDTAFVAKLVDRVNALSPDVVVFTGDIVNRKSSELTPFVKTLSRLSGKDGVYSILGNHDYGDYYSWPDVEAKSANMSALYDMNEQMGWHLLRNETAMLSRGVDSIALIGVENVGDPPFHTYGDLDIAYASLDDPVTKILLSHNPAHWNNDIKDSPDKNIALTLSGHTHAMQMSAFGVSPAALRYPTWGGLYTDSDGHSLYVNIGAGEVAIPARIGATPEITLITLKSK